MNDLPAQALCHCGRPLRHAGRCIGYKPADQAAKSQAAGKTKLRAMVEQEIQICHATIARLKNVIRVAQDQLLDVEARLHPLVTLLEVYRDLALPAPARKPAPMPVVKPTQVTTLTALPPRPVAHEAGPDDDEANFEPVEVDFNQIVAWASVRNLHFKSWDDLPAINLRREAFELPPFKRKLIGLAARRPGSA